MENAAAATRASAAAGLFGPSCLPPPLSSVAAASAAATSAAATSASASRRAFADAASVRDLADGAEKIAEITLQAKRRWKAEVNESGDDDDDESDENEEDRSEASATTAATETTTTTTNVPLFASAPILASSATASNAALDSASFEQVSYLLFRHFLPTSADPRLRRSGPYRSLRSSLHWWLLRRPTTVVAFARSASESLTAFGGAAAMSPAIGWPDVPRKASALRVVREAVSGLDSARAAPVVSVVEWLGRESDGLAALLAGVSIEDVEEEEEEEGEEEVEEEEVSASAAPSASQASTSSSSTSSSSSASARSSSSSNTSSSSSSSSLLPRPRPCACVAPGVPAAHWWFWGRTPAEATAARRAEAEAASRLLAAEAEEEAEVASAAAAVAAADDSLISPRQAVRAS